MDESFNIAEVDNFCVNEGFENKFSYLWALNDYSPFIVDGTSLQIESKEFRDTWSNSWKIKLRVTNLEQGPNLILTSCNNHQGHINLLVCLNFLDDNNAIFCLPGSEPHVKKPVPKHGPGILGHGDSDVAMYRIAYDIRAHLNSLLVEGKLRILLRIWNLNINKESYDSFPLYFAPKVLKSTLTPSLKKLFMNGDFADVTIRVKDTEINAHRNILAARSDVFATMFRAPMVESNTSTVEIFEFSPTVVKGMIEWIYTDNTKIKYEDAASYLQIADLYNLNGLKYEAEFVYAKHLNLENVIQASQFSILYKTKLLRSAVANFIAKNKKILVLDSAFHALPDTIKEDILKLMFSS